MEPSQVNVRSIDALGRLRVALVQCLDELRTALSEAEYRECFACFDTEDFRIGYRAFLAKTPPEFVGR